MRYMVRVVLWFGHGAVVVAAGGALSGCAGGRDITISAKPADAALRVDGQDVGPGPVTKRFEFAGKRAYTVSASRFGYQEQSLKLTRAYPSDAVILTLKPRTRRVTFNVWPVPAVVTVDGKPLSPDRVAQITTDLEFHVDGKANAWLPHTVSAEAPGHRKTDITVRWTDADVTYAIRLEQRRKDVKIVTNPPGAEVFIDEVSAGLSPVTQRNVELKTEPQSGAWVPKTLRAEKKGYETAKGQIGWDDGKSEYVLELPLKRKPVRVVTDPPGAVVKVEGVEMQRDPSGASVGVLPFPPVDDRGDLRTYSAVAEKKAADAEWGPKSFTIGWDDARGEYKVALSEVRDRPVPLLRPRFARRDDGWWVEAERVDTSAMRDVAEPSGAAVKELTAAGALPEGAVVDMLASSPDGTALAFAALSAAADGKLRSRVRVVNVDGSGEPQWLGDGASLDLTPVFSPDGAQVLFSSDRGNGLPGDNTAHAVGRHLSIWSVPANGDPGATALTARLAGDSTDMSPSLDSAPRPRLFFEAWLDGHAEPRIFMAPLKGAARVEMARFGRQPRVSPRADRVLFTVTNPRTGKRDLCTIPDTGGAPTFLTETPDVDEFDPAWSKDGTRIAFVSNRPLADAKSGGDEKAEKPAAKPGDYNIWVMDPSRPETAAPVTRNESWDDNPAWDAVGRAIYFRSNRGGTWRVWSVEVK